jgi:hypothetical protein
MQPFAGQNYPAAGGYGQQMGYGQPDMSQQMAPPGAAPG